MERICECKTKMNLIISWTDINPARRYHRCPICQAFKWYDPPMTLKARIKEMYQCIDELKSERDEIQFKRDKSVLQMKMKVTKMEREIERFKAKMSTQKMVFILLICLGLIVIWFSAETGEGKKENSKLMLV